jgi:hypothetical protein
MNSEQAEGVAMTPKERVLAVWPDTIVYLNRLINAWLWYSTSDVDKVSACFDSEEAAWQNAADSLPQPAQEKPQCPVCRKPSEDYENPEGCWHSVNEKGEIYQNVVPVEAKEKICQNCDHKSHYALRCGALIVSGSGEDYGGEVRCECLKWNERIANAEPKPTPPEPVASEQTDKHEHGWHYGYITCSCGWAWDSRNALTGSLATQHGLRMFEKHKAEPQSSPTSIPMPLVSDSDLSKIAAEWSYSDLETKLACELQEWRKLQRPENGLPDTQALHDARTTPKQLVEEEIINDICKNASSSQRLYFDLATELQQWRKFGAAKGPR